MRLIDVDAITEDEKEIYGFFHDFDLDDLLDGLRPISVFTERSRR